MRNKNSEEVTLTKRGHYTEWQRWLKYTDGSVKVIGLDLGGKATEKYRVGDYAVWHQKGFTGWAGVAMTSYYPPTYYVVKAVEDGPVAFLYHVDANRRTWRKCLSLCKDKVDELAAGHKEN